MSRQVKLPSGRKGWQDRIQKVYGSFEEFERYCEVYGLHTRLGFQHPKNLWELNPLVQGSTNPSDYRIVPEPKKRRRA